LLHGRSQGLYPIFWSEVDSPQQVKSYKLPLAAYFSTGQLVNPATPPAAVGRAALQPEQTGANPTGLLLHRFKPYLNVTIPFRSPQTQQWEPQIRQSDTQSFPLVLVQQTLVTLLSILKPQTSSSTLRSQADDLNVEQFQQAMGQLAGVVVNHPVGASDAYRFNMREAILAAGLVSHPAQVYFVEEAIAALLPELHQPQTPPTEHGGVLVISAGTSVTEMVLAKVPPAGQPLSRSQLALRRLAYAGNALDQDIICQLLAPTAQGWEVLNLRSLNLPLPGEPDLQARYRLQQRLESMPLGRAVLRAVRQLKPTLCQQDVEFGLEGSRWQLRRQDLQNWVLLPYLQQLNREVNLLLAQLELNTTTVQTVICTGGTASIAAIGQWLKTKFPQATIVRSGDPQTPQTTDQRVATGLALLPSFPQVLDPIQHQFSEYFLLRTVLKRLPAQGEPLSAAHIQKLLENGGIPPAASQPFITALLEGQLPAGLLLSKASAVLLSPESIQNADYQELAAAPLFSRQGNQVYRLNRQQRDRLWNHLQVILANTHQTLEEPLSVGLLMAEVVSE